MRNGYDYTNQAWIVDGRYINCSHPPAMACGCYGRLHAGEAVPAAARRFTVHAMRGAESMCSAEAETLREAVDATRKLSSALFPQTWHTFHLVAESE